MSKVMPIKNIFARRLFIGEEVYNVEMNIAPKEDAKNNTYFHFETLVYKEVNDRIKYRELNDGSEEAQRVLAQFYKEYY